MVAYEVRSVKRVSLNLCTVCFLFVCFFQNVVLQNRTPTFQAWLNPPAPIIIEFYLFNLTNPEAVLNEGAKPNLQQIGPYSYK